MARRVVLWWLSALLAACGSGTGLAIDDASGDYPLDRVSRWVDSSGALPCEALAPELVSYAGQELKYARPLRIHRAFQPHLVQFESIVAEVAREHFGRVPRRIVHLGSFACRAVRGRPELASEHALGNAVDIAGFDFGPLPRRAGAPPTLSKAHRRAFQVRLDKHWRGSGKTAPESAFLRALAERLVARPDVFRVVLGPGYPGHHNHFHLDHAPYRLVGLE